MFNKNFYPTPDNVLELMFSHCRDKNGKIKYDGKTILDPSAGKDWLPGPERKAWERKKKTQSSTDNNHKKEELMLLLGS